MNRITLQAAQPHNFTQLWWQRSFSHLFIRSVHSHFRYLHFSFSIRFFLQCICWSCILFLVGKITTLLRLSGSQTFRKNMRRLEVRPKVHILAEIKMLSNLYIRNSTSGRWCRESQREERNQLIRWTIAHHAVGTILIVCSERCFYSHDLNSAF